MWRRSENIEHLEERGGFGDPWLFRARLMIRRSSLIFLKDNGRRDHTLDLIPCGPTNGSIQELAGNTV